MNIVHDVPYTERSIAEQTHIAALKVLNLARNTGFFVAQNAHERRHGNEPKAIRFGAGVFFQQENNGPFIGVWNSYGTPQLSLPGGGLKNGHKLYELQYGAGNQPADIERNFAPDAEREMYEELGIQVGTLSLSDVLSVSYCESWKGNDLFVTFHRETDDIEKAIAHMRPAAELRRVALITPQEASQMPRHHSVEASLQALKNNNSS